MLKLSFATTLFSEQILLLSLFSPDKRLQLSYLSRNENHLAFILYDYRKREILMNSYYFFDYNGNARSLNYYYYHASRNVCMLKMTARFFFG